MKKSPFLFLSLLAIFSCPLQAAAPAQPNIVLMLVDDMGVMDTSVPFLTNREGKPEKHPLNQFYHTPNMERLARQGVRFSQFNAMSVCSPTRATIMTGQNPARHGTTNWIHSRQNNKGKFGPPSWNWHGLQPSDVTLPALLRGSGYRTIHLGKGHFSPDGGGAADPKAIGFDVNIGGGTMGQPGSYYGKENFAGRNADRARLAVPGLGKYHGQEIFLTEALSLEAISEIDRSVNAQKPFFLYFAHYAVHSPFQSDPRFAKRYKNSGRNPAAQAYATLIEGMDKSLGDLLDHLDSRGIANNTLVIFLGDNGGDSPIGGAETAGSSAPLRGKKGSCYEGGVRVPFIAAWAKPDDAVAIQKRLPIAAGAIQSQLASVEDIFPTLLALTEITPPARHVVDGRKLQGLLGAEPDRTRPEVFLMHYPHEHRSSYWSSFREGHLKVIHRYQPAQGKSSCELYDLRLDPYEQKDLAAARPEELNRMMGLLKDALEKHHASYPISKDGRALKPDY